MSQTARRWTVLLVVVVLAIALASTPAIAHEGHDHEGEEGSGLSIWPFFLVFGSVTAGGSLLAGYRFDVSRQHAIGVAAGGAVMAAIAAVAVFG